MRRLLPLVLLVALAVPAQAQTPCYAIVSMSQGGQVYQGSQVRTPEPSGLEALTGHEWMAVIVPGKVLSWWADPANWDLIAERYVRDRCTPDSQIAGVLFIFDPYGSDMGADVASVVGILHARYPAANVRVSLLVGGQGHVSCQVPNPFGNLSTVRASRTHAQAIGGMTMPEAGPDLDIPCAGYADTLGHLNDSGAQSAQAQVAAFYQGAPPPPDGC